jgi:hypothetical protein
MPIEHSALSKIWSDESYGKKKSDRAELGFERDRSGGRRMSDECRHDDENLSKIGMWTGQKQYREGHEGEISHGGLSCVAKSATISAQKKGKAAETSQLRYDAQV